MTAIIGNAIVIVIIAALVFFCGRRVIRDFKREISGGGCAGCSGVCAGCTSACAHAKPADASSDDHNHK